jgi:hypothetical protein
MKVTLNRLKQYVDFNWSPAELAGRLTINGTESVACALNQKSVLS